MIIKFTILEVNMFFTLSSLLLSPLLEDNRFFNFNMFINCNKTKCMTVGTKQKLAFQNEELSLTINFE